MKCRHENRSTLLMGAVATAQDLVAQARRFLKLDDPDSAESVLEEVSAGLQTATIEASRTGGDPCGDEPAEPATLREYVARAARDLKAAHDLAKASTADGAAEADDGICVALENVYRVLSHLEDDAGDLAFQEAAKVARERTGLNFCPKCGSPNVLASDVEVVTCRACGYSPHAKKPEPEPEPAPDLPEGVVGGTLVP